MAILLLLLCAVLAYGVAGDATVCVDGIQTAVTLFTFADSVEYWTDICDGNSTTISIWAAAKEYCTPAEIEAGSVLLGGYCLEYAEMELVPYAETAKILTDQYMKDMQVVNFEDIDPTKVWDNPVLISKSLWETSTRTVGVFSESYLIHARYGWAVYGFWGGLLLLGIISRLIAFVFSSQIERHTGDIEKVTRSRLAVARPSKVMSFVAGTYHWSKANFIIPAAFGSHHQRLKWWCSVPTRMESVVVLAYYALSLILCAVSYDIFSPNLYYSDYEQKCRYVADRTGIICYANLPVLWMFSGRNNIFLWATGWNFSTFNTYHRHIARIATIQAIIHSAAYTMLEIESQGYKDSWKEEYWYMGGMATVTMSLILGFSSIFIRQKCYEVFLIIHISLSVATIVGLFYHTRIFSGEYDGYLWPMVAIWVFDRFARIVRQVYCNIHVKRSLEILHTTSTATYSKEADLIRLEVTPGSECLKPKPNQHYFLYQPPKWRGWENHPFTLASWTTIDDDKTTISDNKPASTTKTTPLVDISPTSASLDSSSNSGSDMLTNPAHPQPQPHGRYKFLFYIRPSTGWTQRLRNQCIKHPSGPVKTRILLEGPYGETTPLHHYENVILLTGGTGIAGALPYLEDHVARSAKGTTMTHSITMLWAAKQLAILQDIAARELWPVLGREDVNISFHVTSKSGSGPAVDDGKLHAAAGGQTPDDIHVKYGRPDIRGKVLEVIKGVREAGNQGGRVAVLVCGPAGMADEARSAVHLALKSGMRGVDYIEETFGW